LTWLRGWSKWRGKLRRIIDHENGFSPTSHAPWLLGLCRSFPPRDVLRSQSHFLGPSLTLAHSPKLKRSGQGVSACQPPVLKMKSYLRNSVLLGSALLASAIGAQAQAVDYAASVTANMTTVETLWGKVAVIMISVALVVVTLRFFRKAK